MVIALTPAQRTSMPPMPPAPMSPARSAHVFAEAPRASARDTGIDLVRAVCVVLVVLLHGLMAGVTIGESGPVFANATEDAAWFAPVTWVLQIMPPFFVIGGFAGAIAYRRMRERGGSAVDFVTARIHRLVMPAVLTIAAAGVVLAVLAASGVAPELVQIAGFRFSQPLWFLAVFLLCQALLPALLAWHERAPLRSILVLAAAAGLVDVVRASTGIYAIGALNFALVWLALQRVGFFLADGRIDALRRRTRIRIGLGAVGMLGASFALGIFSPDLIANLNPPTVALLLVGVAQTALLSLFRPWLAEVSARPRVARFTGFVTARTMTIYLWHMPVLLVMAGATAVFAMDAGIDLPEFSSPSWFVTRPLWIGCALVLTALVAWAFAGGEKMRMPVRTASTSRAVQAAVLGLLGVVALLAAGATVLTAALAVGLMVLALMRIRPARG